MWVKCDVLFPLQEKKDEANWLSCSLNVEMQPLFLYSDAQINTSNITSLEESLCLIFWIFFTVNPDFKNSFFFFFKASEN